MSFFPSASILAAAATVTHCEPAEAPDAPHLQPDGPTEGVKHDQGKLRMELLPPDAIREVAAVMTFGANKYGDRNWEKGMNWSRLIGAAKRHLTDFELREDFDDETNLLSLAHAATDILFLLAFQLRNTGTDDRPVLEQ